MKTNNWITYWWEVVGEDSPCCGEEFFTELKNDNEATHFNYAKTVFPGEEFHCLGRVSVVEAEFMGLDTY